VSIRDQLTQWNIRSYKVAVVRMIETVLLIYLNDGMYDLFLYPSLSLSKSVSRIFFSPPKSRDPTGPPNLLACEKLIHNTRAGVGCSQVQDP
jgi:hypothetical protein